MKHLPNIAFSDIKVVKRVAFSFKFFFRLFVTWAAAYSIDKNYVTNKKAVGTFTLSTVGSILVSEKKYDDAIKAFTKRLELYPVRTDLFPEQTDGLNLLGICYSLKGDETKAKQLFNEMLSKDSTNTRAMTYLRIMKQGSIIW